MMSARFKKVRVCSCFLFLFISASQALADAPDKELVKVAQPPVDDQTEPAPAAVLDYSSVFDDYLSYDDIPDIGWKEANDNVGEIGGWRAYANLVQDEARMKAELEAKENARMKAELEAEEKARMAADPEDKENEGDQ